VSDITRPVTYRLVLQGIGQESLFLGEIVFNCDPLLVEQRMVEQVGQEAVDRLAQLVLESLVAQQVN